MAIDRKVVPVPTLAIRPDQALVGIPASDDGQEVTLFFADEEANARASSDQILQAALAAIGSWNDLDWEETVTSLERIRRASEPTPPIEDL